MRDTPEAEQFRKPTCSPLTSTLGALVFVGCGTLGTAEQAAGGPGQDQKPGLGNSGLAHATASPPNGTAADASGNAPPASGSAPTSSASPSGGPMINSTASLPDPAPVAAAYSQPLRRLSHHEYTNTLKSLLQQVQVTLPTLANEETIDGFSNHWDAQQPSDLLIQQYFDVALDVAEALDDAKLQALVGCTSGIDCATAFITQFGKQAYRRPLTAEETEAYLALFQSGPGSTDFALAARLAIAAFLQSPHFLYRVEFGIGTAELPLGKRLAPYETATRLSYLLWADMPDAELFEAAESADLETPEGIETQTMRMLASPKAKEGVTSFFREWLRLSKLNKLLKLPEENWDTNFKADLAESVIRFTYDQVFTQGGSARDLLLATRFPMTLRVAELFGVEATGTEWQDLDVNPAERSGILTHPGILGAYGYGEYPSPVLRGVFVLDRFLCMPPVAPPDPAVAQPPAAGNMDTPRTNREAYVKVTSGNGCSSCHVAINGIGFGFENYDTVGRYRTKDAGFDVDASGALGAFVFDNAVEFSKQLADSKEYQSCVVAKWATYALGGSPLASDAAFLGDLKSRFAANNFSLKELLLAIATHERFSGRLATTDADL